jgi:hypothetical protein
MWNLISLVDPETIISGWITVIGKMMAKTFVFNNTILSVIDEDTVIAYIVMEIPSSIIKAHVLRIDPEAVLSI